MENDKSSKYIKTTFKEFLNESNSIDNISQLYDKYGKLYPYAVDAIAYYIFGDKSDDNKLVKAYSGTSDKGSEIDSSEVSEYMMGNEFSWEDNISDIDNYIKNIPTKDGSILSDYF